MCTYFLFTCCYCCCCSLTTVCVCYYSYPYPYPSLSPSPLFLGLPFLSLPLLTIYYQALLLPNSFFLAINVYFFIRLLCMALLLASILIVNLWLYSLLFSLSFISCNKLNLIFYYINYILIVVYCYIIFV